MDSPRPTFLPASCPSTQFPATRQKILAGPGKGALSHCCVRRSSIAMQLHCTTQHSRLVRPLAGRRLLSAPTLSFRNGARRPSCLAKHLDHHSVRCTAALEDSDITRTEALESKLVEASATLQDQPESFLDRLIQLGKRGLVFGLLILAVVSAAHRC